MFSLNNYIFFSGKHDGKNICRRCLSSYSNRIVLIKHLQSCEEQEITAIKRSDESHQYYE